MSSLPPDQLLLRPGDLGLLVVLRQAVQVVVELFDPVLVALRRFLPDSVRVLKDKEQKLI